MDAKAEGGERKAETTRKAVRMEGRDDVVSQAALVVTELTGNRLLFQSFGNGEAEQLADNLVHIAHAIMENIDGWDATLHDGKPAADASEQNGEQKATEGTDIAGSLSEISE